MKTIKPTCKCNQFRFVGLAKNLKPYLETYIEVMDGKNPPLPQELDYFGIQRIIQDAEANY